MACFKGISKARDGLHAVISLLVCLLLSAVAVAGEPERLTAVVLDDFSPLYVTDVHGGHTGFATEVFRALARREGFEYDLLPVKNWKEALQAVRDGRADVIPGIATSIAHDGGFLFTDVFGTVSMVCFVRVGCAEINGPRDLAGRRVGVINRSAAENVADSIEGVELTRYATVEDLLFGLLTAKTDAAIFPEPMLLKKARALGLADRIKVVGEPLMEIKRTYLLRQDEAALAGRLSRALTGFVSTNEFNEIYRRWWGAPDPFWTVGRIVLGSTILLVLTAVGLVLWRYRSITVLNQGLEEARRKLEASETRLNKAQEVAVIGSFERDLDTGIGHWSDGLFKLLGMEVQPEAPPVETFIGMIHPEDRDNYLRGMVDVSPEAAEYSLEFRFKPADGDEYRHASCRFSYEFAGDGTPVKRIGAFQDITDRKRIEAELKKAILAAETASRTKSEFLANMSHELRTPLNGAMGMLQLLAMDELHPRHREYVETALSACKGLTQLLGDILDLSKVEAGRLELSSEEFVLSEVLTSVEETFGYLARDKNLRLECVVAPDVPDALEGDPARLRQILFNLVGNALKFTDEGAVTVDVCLLWDDSPEGCRLLFSVADTGIGIPDSMVEGVFGAFTQVDGAHTRKYQGTGLGLHIVKRLIGLMGGHLSVDSELSRGTTIYFSVPFFLAAGGAETLGGTGDGEAEAIGPKHVLVVEDERTNRLAICRLLQMLGHSVKWVSNGLEALQQMALDDYDLIFMDIQMPVMNGIEATARIRGAENLGPKKDIPIVALTAHAMSGDKETFLKAGMTGYLSKPVDLAELKRVLARSFRKTSA